MVDRGTSATLGRRRIGVARAGVLGLLASMTLLATMPLNAAPIPGTPAYVISPPDGEDIGFIPTVLAITQGGSLTFANADTVSHNVVCVDIDPATRRPLCRSDLVAIGGTATVTGVATLAPGTYDLYCQLHPQMIAELTVLDTP